MTKALRDDNATGPSFNDLSATFLSAADPFVPGYSTESAQSPARRVRTMLRYLGFA